MTAARQLITNRCDCVYLELYVSHYGFTEIDYSSASPPSAITKMFPGMVLPPDGGTGSLGMRNKYLKTGTPWDPAWDLDLPDDLPDADMARAIEL